MVKKYLSLFLSALLFTQACAPTYAAITEPDRTTLGTYKNFATNGGAENGKAGWTVSGTSASLSNLVLDASNKYEGNYGFAWTPANADNFLSNTAIPITSGVGLSKRDCAAMVYAKSATGTHALEAYNSTTGIVINSTPIPVSDAMAPVSVNFPCPDSGNIVVRFKAGNTTTLYFDFLKDGDARGVNIGTAVGAITTPWVSFPMVIEATANPTRGTVVRESAMWRRVGDSMQISYSLQTSSGGSAGSGNYRFLLPVGYTADLTKINNSNSATNFQNVSGPAQAYQNAAAAPGFDGVAFYDPTTNAFRLTVGNNANPPADVSSSFVALNNTQGVYYSFMATVPILGWSDSYTGSTYTPDAGGLAAGDIVATASTSCPAGTIAAEGQSLARASYPALFAAIGTAHGTADGASFNVPDYRGRFLRGFANGSSNDPDRASRTAMNTGGATGDNVGTVQGDGFASHNHGGGSHSHVTASIDISGGAYNAGGAYLGKPGPNNGANPAVNSSGTIINSEGGNETRPKNAYVKYCVRTVAAIAAIPLVGMVTTTAPLVPRLESADIGSPGTQCSSGSCTVTTGSSWISSATWSSIGTYVVSFVNGTFSSAPECVFSLLDFTGSNPPSSFISSKSATGLTVRFLNSTTYVNVSWTMMCKGPR